MEFRVLGTFEARDHGRPIDLGGPQQRLVLALLVASVNEVVSTDRLVDEIWGDSPPGTARKTVQGYISALRKTLGGDGGPLKSRPPGYVLEVEPTGIDAVEFAERVAVARGVSPTNAGAARADLVAALALWRGPPYADLADHIALRPEISRLEQLRLSALEERITADLAMGDGAGVVHELEGLTGEHPLRERLRGLHMMALYRSGRQAEALRAFQETRRVLAEELGLDPSPELQRLEQQILDQDPLLDTPEAFAVRVPVRESPAAVRNPYKGLRAFEETDAEDFYGRNDLVRRLAERLNARDPTGRLVVLAGPSGSGKSSVVRAGLIPLLRSGAPGSAGWLIVDMFPGSDPIGALAKAFADVSEAPGELAEQLSRFDLSLGELAATAVPEAGDLLLLVIDQFEELFTLVHDPSIRERFLDLLLAAVTDPVDRVRVVVTIRADYLDRPLQHAGFAELLEPSLLLVSPLSDHEVRAAVVEPAAHVGVRPEPDLVVQIARDVAARPASLPLLQYALTDLFERRRGDVLTLEGYLASGGILGALSRRADDLYAELSDAAREVTRQLFRRLVTSTDAGEHLRRRVARDELDDLPFDRDALDQVLLRFGEHRLLTFDRDPQTGAATVEVAHEALLREWRRLRDWIEASRDDLLLNDRLIAAAADWSDAGRDPSYLVGGSRLTQYEALASGPEFALTRTETDFIVGSRARAAAEEQQKRRRRRTLTGVLTGATIIALALAGFAFAQRERARDQTEIAQQESQRAQEQTELVRQESQRAEEQAQVARDQTEIAQWEGQRAQEQAQLARDNEQLARIREFAAAAVGELDNDPQRSLLLALTAVEMSLDFSGGPVREVEEALRRAILESRLELIITPGDDVGGIDPVAAVFDPAGQRLAVGSTDGVVRIFDPESGKLLSLLEGHAGAVVDVKWARDGTRLLTVSIDGTARLWELAEGIVNRVFGPIAEGMLIGSFSPDESRVVTTALDGTVRVWDVASGDEALRVDIQPSPPLQPVGVAFEPVTGERIAVAVAGPGELGAGVLVHDAETGDLELKILMDDGACELRWSPDGTKLATASNDTTGRVWDASTGAEIARFSDHHSFMCAVDFSPDGSLVATGGDDGTARIWEASTGKPIIRLEGHDERLGFVSFSPDGARLASSSGDGTIRIWDVRPEGRREVVAVADATVIYEARYSPDGDRFVTASDSGVARVWDSVTGLPITSLVGHGHWVYAAAFTADGSRVVTGSRDLTVRIWDALTGEQIAARDVPLPALGVAMSPDGSTVAIGTEASFHLWNFVTDQFESFESNDQFFGVAFSPDGSRVAAGRTVDILVFDVASFEASDPIESTDKVAFDKVLSVGFTGDGTRLLTAHRDGTARLWDIDQRREIIMYEGHNGLVWEAALSPDESMVATASFDGTVRVWNTTTAEELLRFEDDQAFSSISFSPDGTHLLVSGDFGARVHTLDIDELLDLARSRLLRPWTPEECFQFLSMETCPPPPLTTR
ncbi:MAG: winged helix-turn-helix domain-containing protein [Acidimicrobiia bacterium]|nr:winged helix-turn-helix domain-containing protein [Acidimicrobiia bacterium]